jgi:hypothetical protein
MDYEKLKEMSFYMVNTPLPGYTLSNQLQLLAQNHFNISFRYFPRLIYSFSLSGIMLPFRIKERILFDKKIWETKIKHDPFFILGHWRSGTTYLHNILSIDSQWGFFTTFQAYLPGLFLGSEKTWKPLVISSIPDKRPMDDVKMNADYPQEDQYAIGAMSPFSYYHGWCYPKNMEKYNRYVLMDDDIPNHEIRKWKKIYLYLIKKVTFAVGGKQLVLKNQDNTAKIRLLLDLFPNAKFLLIQRNPISLYYSMSKFMRIVIPRYCVQNPPPFEMVEDSMIKLYAEMFRKYLNERSLIPEGNLVEIKYEDFISDPLMWLKYVYNNLGLEGYSKNKEKFSSYIERQKSVKGGSYDISDIVVEKLKKHWDFVFKAFNYSI